MKTAQVWSRKSSQTRTDVTKKWVGALQIAPACEGLWIKCLFHFNICYGYCSREFCVLGWSSFFNIFIVIGLELWWWTMYALFSTYAWLNCVSNMIDIVCGVDCCVTETYCLFVFLICFFYYWGHINYIKVVENTFCFWIFYLQFSYVSCVY